MKPAFGDVLAAAGCEAVPGEAVSFEGPQQAGNLAHPYGQGNHRRISWRRAWDVDREGLTATHRGTGFVLQFAPSPGGGYAARIGCELAAFGPDGELAMAQMFGLRELLADGWDIFHTVMRKA